MEKFTQLIARIFIGFIFLLAGLSKIGNIDGTAGYMESMGVHGILLYPVIVLEVAAGLAIIAGWMTRLFSLALAAFTALAAIIFHSDFADQTQIMLFMKNVAISGGLLLLVVHGTGVYSVDYRRRKALTAESGRRTG